VLGEAPIEPPFEDGVEALSAVIWEGVSMLVIIHIYPL
jgi:hypothetical protein